ncbi:MAG: hypothetical protein AB7V36_14060 [Bacteroidales bacterium]
MRKVLVFILIVSAIIIASCEKATEVLPPEYEYLLGEWEMDSCIIIYRPNEIIEQRDTLSAFDLGYNMRFVFKDVGFIQYVENTKMVDAKSIEYIEITTSDENPSSLGYYIHYRTLKPFVTYGLSIGYNSIHETLKYAYARDYSTNFITYVYVFKRK